MDERAAKRRAGWGFLIGRVVDDIRGTLRVLTIVLACSAIGTAIFGAADPQGRGDAMVWAVFVLMLAAFCAALWAAVERWRRARSSRATGRPLKQ